MHLDAGDAASYPGSGTAWTDFSRKGTTQFCAEAVALKAEVERPESGVSYEAFVSAMQIVTIERDALRAEKVNLQDDLASVERERAHQQGRADRNAAEYAREQKKREQLQAENARLREALDFYGDAVHYVADAEMRKP
jgi:septal ring factor EnvC (AmiA/AmiB activator)